MWQGGLTYHLVTDGILFATIISLEDVTVLLSKYRFNPIESNCFGISPKTVFF